MRFRLSCCLAAAVLLGIAPGCDSSSPSGPRGRIITVTAEPETIDVGASSSILVVARRPDGNPAANESVAMATNLGTIEDARLTLDGAGEAMTVLQAGNEEGDANVVASMETGGEVSTGVTTVLIRDIEPPQLAADETALEKTHTRDQDPCPNPFDPIMLSNTGDGDLDFRIEGDPPSWLDVDPIEGAVPLSVDLAYNCEGVEQNQTLEGSLVLVGVDPDSLETVGDPVTVDVSVVIVPQISL